MQSRMEKYYQPKKTEAKRSDRNAKLYQEIYKNYDSLENLPLSNNINEIDATSLKKMVLEKEEVKEEKNLKYKEEVTENSFSRREKLDENKIHDINKLLEHAKKENSKLKDDTITRKSYNFLSTLESKELTKEEVMKAKEAYEKKSDIPDNEVKYQTKKISVDPSIEQVLTNTASLSLDILSDLKPNDDNSGVV